MSFVDFYASLVDRESDFRMAAILSYLLDFFATSILANTPAVWVC